MPLYYVTPLILYGLKAWFDIKKLGINQKEIIYEKYAN